MEWGAPHVDSGAPGASGSLAASPLWQGPSRRVSCLQPVGPRHPWHPRPSPYGPCSSARVLLPHTTRTPVTGTARFHLLLHTVPATVAVLFCLHTGSSYRLPCSLTAEVLLLTFRTQADCSRLRDKNEGPLSSGPQDGTEGPSPLGTLRVSHALHFLTARPVPVPRARAPPVHCPQPCPVSRPDRIRVCSHFRGLRVSVWVARVHSAPCVAYISMFTDCWM